MTYLVKKADGSYASCTMAMPLLIVGRSYTSNGEIVTVVQVLSSIN